ncbi:developmental pluripotency-associated 5 protein [Myotis lucifugus]|nr:developmental pluripotency-associated 5 protein [Myotis lucifugus]
MSFEIVDSKFPGSGASRNWNSGSTLESLYDNEFLNLVSSLLSGRNDSRGPRIHTCDVKTQDPTLREGNGPSFGTWKAERLKLDWQLPGGSRTLQPGFPLSGVQAQPLVPGARVAPLSRELPRPRVSGAEESMQAFEMGTMPRRKDIPPWVKVPEDLRDPEVLQVQTALLEAMFGPGGSRIPYIEQVSRAMLELKVLESSNLTEVVVYGNYLYKLRTKWMLQSMAERHRLRQERGMLRLEDAMSALELGL